ncbi:hypothetical protein C0Q70_10453 [Pomacea canaliculata]|uniref:Uncharacterized protein n=1 Tax=Pomacea canaliculata TaxID=400727 RepID=A0A2T7P393_POMCA|nr:hypothetical protein C0Q70_10453 [Pomacea canaliculata]
MRKGDDPMRHWEEDQSGRRRLLETLVCDVPHTSLGVVLRTRTESSSALNAAAVDFSLSLDIYVISVSYHVSRDENVLQRGSASDTSRGQGGQ